MTWSTVLLFTPASHILHIQLKMYTGSMCVSTVSYANGTLNKGALLFISFFVIKHGDVVSKFLLFGDLFDGLDFSFK